MAAAASFQIFCGFLSILLGQSSEYLQQAGEFTFYGAADISAAVFLDPNHFATANDESNVIRIYSIGKGDKLIAGIDLSEFLAVESRFPEADIEAAARVDETIYWVTSHGRNKDGKVRLSRYRFFATKIRNNPTEGTVSIEPFGNPCKTLIEQLLAYPKAEFLNLEQAVQMGAELSKKEREKLAPKKKGLNMEAMTYLPERGSLLIGLRNPLYKADKKSRKKAIAFELLNPAETAAGQAAKFGEIVLWDLQERGLRGMEYDPSRKVHFILAGPVDEESTCAMYVWDGDFEHCPALAGEWSSEDTFTPEGIAVHPVSGALWIFSDDGTLEKEVRSPAECMEGELLPNGKCPNKFLTDELRKSFRVRVYEQPMEFPQL